MVWYHRTAHSPGAVMMDQGAASASMFVLDMFVPLIDGMGIDNMMKMQVDPRKQLFSFLLSEQLPQPTYEVLKETGT
jgi:dsRNA-specific ribonuclease